MVESENKTVCICGQASWWAAGGSKTNA
jgi:hypothetical protein